MREFVRVRDKRTGHLYSTRFPNDNHEIVDRPAVDANGRALPPKPRVESARSTKKKSAPTPAKSEEN